MSAGHLFAAHPVADLLRLLVFLLILVTVFAVCAWGRFANPTTWWWIGAIVLFSAYTVYSQISRLGQPVSPRLPLAVAASFMAAVAATRRRRVPPR